MDPKIISIIAAAIAVSFGAIGPALAEGRAVAAAMDAIARQPEAANTLSRTLFVGLAMLRRRRWRAPRRGQPSTSSCRRRPYLRSQPVPSPCPFSSSGSHCWNSS